MKQLLEYKISKNEFICNNKYENQTQSHCLNKYYNIKVSLNTSNIKENSQIISNIIEMNLQGQRSKQI